MDRAKDWHPTQGWAEMGLLGPWGEARGQNKQK